VFLSVCDVGGSVRVVDVRGSSVGCSSGVSVVGVVDVRGSFSGSFVRGSFVGSFGGVGCLLGVGSC
jgi:hypothetical protein